MEMKKRYEEPGVEVVRFADDDILTISPGGPIGPWDPQEANIKPVKW